MEDILFNYFVNYLQARDPEALIPQVKGNGFRIQLIQHNGEPALSVERVLGNKNILPLEVFRLVIRHLLGSPGYRQIIGNAIAFPIGQGNMTPDSVEAFVAMEYYKKNVGDWAFMRGHAIRYILVATGICERANGFLSLRLNNNFQETMQQPAYDEWVERTPPRIHDQLSGGSFVSPNEKHFANTYGNKTLLDIGCGTGHRTFPVWEKMKFSYAGMEKSLQLIDSSRYKKRIVQGDMSAPDFMSKVPDARMIIGIDETVIIDLVVLLGGMMNAFLDESIRANAWQNLAELSKQSSYILLDTLTHFDWYPTDESGRIERLYEFVPPQYFYSKKELERLFETYRLTVIETREEPINHLIRTHFLLKRDA